METKQGHVRVVSFTYYLVGVVSFSYSLGGVVSFAYYLVRDSYIPFSFFFSAYPLQLLLFSLSSSAYYLQLTVFSLLSPTYCLQLTVPKMQLSGMGWSCRLYNKVVSHE